MPQKIGYSMRIIFPQQVLTEAGEDGEGMASGTHFGTEETGMQISAIVGHGLLEIGRRLEALEAGQAGLDEALGRCGLHGTTLHYAPVGLSGARNCFVLALLNREGDGVVLNSLAGRGVIRRAGRPRRPVPWSERLFDAALSSA
jgi:hypothetical protein